MKDAEQKIWYPLGDVCESVCVRSEVNKVEIN